MDLLSLHQSFTVLYIFVSVAQICIVLVTTPGRSFIKRTKSVGPSTLPCGIPLVTLAYSDFPLSIITLCHLFVRKF